MFKPGDKKPEKSGRKTGVPNKRTQTVIELVEASGKNPIEVMCDLLSDADPALRLSAAKELAQYIFPKRRALDVELAPTAIVTQVPVTSEYLLSLVQAARNSGPKKQGA